MKLLATDYDGTFKSDLKNLYLNINAVDKFMNNGNKFALITGRSFVSIKEEIKRYKINYDYLSCNNGLIVFDNKDNIISSTILPIEDIIYINDLIQDINIKKLELYNFYDSTTYIENILEIYIKFKSIYGADKFKKYIESIFPNIKCYKDFNKLFIGNNITKADAVSIIQKIENIDYKDVYTVGDNSNDIEMLEKFNGYKMLYSYPGLWLKKLPVTNEVHTLIKKINK